VVSITVLISEPGINQPKDTTSVCENPARIARVTKSDRKAPSTVVAPMLAYGRQVSASQEVSAAWYLTIILALLPDRLSFSQPF
jgi:hypothetical protein